MSNRRFHRIPPVERLLGFLAVLAALGIGGVPDARASIVYTYTGNNNNNNPVDVKADITLGNGTMTVVLTNYYNGSDEQANQALNGVSIVFNTLGPLAVNTATASPTNHGSVVTINGNGSTSPSNNTSDWNYSETGSTVVLTSIGNTGGSPAIIGPGPYTNPGGSLTAGQHYFIQQTATFVVSVAGLTPDGSISSLTFRFGTDTSDQKQGDLQPPAVPEPATIAMAGFAGLAVLAHARRRRQN
jgi:hypothetical protein